MDIIKSFIDKHGSQEKAGKRLGVSQTAVWNWLNDRSKPSLKHARIIASDLRVSLEDVYEGRS